MELNFGVSRKEESHGREKASYGWSLSSSLSGKGGDSRIFGGGVSVGDTDRSTPWTYPTLPIYRCSR
jgi:hypothetical protein